MYKHIMVPLDGSELAECVLGHVIDIAKSCQSPRVTLVRVVTPIRLYGSEMETTLSADELQKLENASVSDAETYLAKVGQQLKRNGIDVRTEVRFGNVVEHLVDFADKNGVDLIVIATHGRSGVSRWVWGSVAERILRSARVPVLMVRPVSCQRPELI